MLAEVEAMCDMLFKGLFHFHKETLVTIDPAIAATLSVQYFDLTPLLINIYLFWNCSSVWWVADDKFGYYFKYDPSVSGAVEVEE